MNKYETQMSEINELKNKTMEYGYYWVNYDCYKIVIAEWIENKDGADYWGFIGDEFKYNKEMCKVICYINEPKR